MIVYGIKNCDSVKKALKALDEKNMKYTFHDFRKDGLTEDIVKGWMEVLGEALVNKRSTTWKLLSESERLNVTPALIVKNPTLIKRPLVECDKGIFVGKIEQVL